MDEHERLPERRLPAPPGVLWPIALIGTCCVVLIAWLRTEGVLLSILIVSLAYIVVKQRPDNSEAESLATSIRLSAEDISDVIDDYTRFLTSSDPDIAADRLLKRPALADADCSHPDIENFYFHYTTAKRFVARLQSRLSADMSIPELETLLSVTDRRAFDLRESWMIARRTALKLGTDYTDNT